MPHEPLRSGRGADPRLARSKRGRPAVPARLPAEDRTSPGRRAGAMAGAATPDARNPASAPQTLGIHSGPHWRARRIRTSGPRIRSRHSIQLSYGRTATRFNVFSGERVEPSIQVVPAYWFSKPALQPLGHSTDCCPQRFYATVGGMGHRSHQPKRPLTVFKITALSRSARPLLQRRCARLLIRCLSQHAWPAQPQRPCQIGPALRPPPRTALRGSRAGGGAWAAGAQTARRVLFPAALVREIASLRRSWRGQTVERRYPREPVPGRYAARAVALVLHGPTSPARMESIAAASPGSG